MKFEETPPYLNLLDRIKCAFLKEKLPIDIEAHDRETGETAVLVPAGKIISGARCQDMARRIRDLRCYPSPISRKISEIRAKFEAECEELARQICGEPPTKSRPASQEPGPDMP